MIKSTDTLDRSTLLDIDKLQAEMREAHRLLKVHKRGHYWTPQLDTFMNVVLPGLKQRIK